MYAKMKDFKCLIASRLSLKFPKIQNLNYQLDILDNHCLVKLCTDHKFCELIMFLFGRLIPFKKEYLQNLIFCEILWLTSRKKIMTEIDKIFIYRKKTGLLENYVAL